MKDYLINHSADRQFNQSYEFKYPFSLEVSTWLDAQCLKLECEISDYEVFSFYYLLQTPSQNLEQIKRYRFRYYWEIPDKIWFEYKINYDVVRNKERYLFNTQSASYIDCLIELEKKSYIPYLVCQYKRQRYYFPNHELTLTVDRDISFSRPRRDEVPHTYVHQPFEILSHDILEIKSLDFSRCQEFISDLHLPFMLKHGKFSQGNSLYKGEGWIF